MAEYFVTQTDIDLLLKPKKLHLRAYLLNEKNLIVDNLEGLVINGDGSDDANSDIRKNCNFTIHSINSTYDIGEYNRIWLNNRIRIDLGFEDNDNKIYWYTKGIYVFDNCDYAYDASTKDITFQCSDLVNTLNGTHNGALLGESFLIEGCTLNEATGLYEGNDIKKVVEDLLKQNGINEFKVGTIGQVSCLQGYAVNWKQNRIDTGTTQEEVDKDESNGYDDLQNDHGTWHMIPYDLEFNAGVTLWEILVKIRDLYPGYEMFFDKDGVFVFQLIPICQHDTNILDHTQFEGLVTSENADFDLTTVRNATKVYGQSIETDRYSEECTLSTSIFENNTVSTISPIFESTFAYSGNIVIGIVFPDGIQRISTNNAYLTINNETYPLVERKAVVSENSDGNVTNSVQYINLQYSRFNTTDIYCFKYLSSQKLWVYVGMYQIEGYYENNDQSSPFAIDKIGIRLQVKSDGEYKDIITSTLAQERAEYETWLTSRLTDTVTLETVIIPFLEVNQKIEYRKLSNGSIDSYIIKSLSYSFTEGTMTITMCKFYPLDPFIVCS